jgi:UPF0271 protein
MERYMAWPLAMKKSQLPSPMPCDRSESPVLGMAFTAHEIVYKDQGIELVPEFYADLEYDGDGNLILSRVHDAVDPVKAAARVLRVMREQVVTTTTGRDIPVKATTVCVHSDTRSAAAIAAELRRVLEGVAIRS